MKYIVGLKYTNPSHEHVSLRRRVESRNAVVEASNEEEAILRASRQQRALGFTVREAGIVNSNLNESVQVNESNEEVESVDEAKKQLKPSYWRAEWRLGTQSEVDKNNKKIFDKLAKTDPVKAAAFHDNLMKLKKKDMKEEVEQIDEISNKTLKSYLKKKHTQVMQDLGAAKSERERNKIRSAHDSETKPANLRVNAYNSGRRGDLTYHGVGDDSRGPLNKILKKKYKEGQKNMTKSGQVFQKQLAKQGIVSDEFVAEAKGEPPAEFMPSDTKLPRIKVPAKPKPGVRKRGPIGSFNKKGFWNPGVRYEEVEQVEEAKVSTVGASKASDSELANYLKKKVKKAQSNQAKGTAGYPLLKKGEKLKPMKMKEEVELDEAKADPKLALKAMDLRHGVDTDKRVAGYKMSDPVRKAQAKFDAQTKAQQVKKVQAGTLAAQRQRELAKKTDEATDPGKTRVVNKKVKTEKAAETMIAKAKGMRNQINMKPELNSDGQKKV